MDNLRSRVIKLAYGNPELRRHLVPLLRRAAEESFEEAVKDKKFKNPETGNEVVFDSLPAEEQKKIREEWSKKKEDPKKEEPTNAESSKKEEPDKEPEWLPATVRQKHKIMSVTEEDLDDLSKTPRDLAAYQKQDKALYDLRNTARAVLQDKDLPTPEKRYVQKVFKALGEAGSHLMRNWQERQNFNKKEERYHKRRESR